MKEIDYTKQLYLYDDRSKYDYMLKVTDIIFEDKDTIVCKTVMVGVPDYDGQVEEEKIMIDKETGEVKNSDYWSWYATSDQDWIKKEIEHLIKRAE